MDNNKANRLPTELIGSVIDKNRFCTIDTINDSSNIFHSIFFAINLNNYQSKNNDDRREIVKTERRKLAEEYYNMYEKNSIPYNFKKIYESITAYDNSNFNGLSDKEKVNKNARIMTDYSTTLSSSIIPYLEAYYNTHIFFVDINRDKYKNYGFYCYYFEKDFSLYSHTIMLLRKNNKFEPLVIEHSSNVYTSKFYSTDSFVTDALKYCQLPKGRNSSRSNSKSNSRSNTNRYNSNRNNSSRYASRSDYDSFMNLLDKRSIYNDTSFFKNYAGYRTAPQINFQQSNTATIILIVLIILFSLLFQYF